MHRRRNVTRLLTVAALAMATTALAHPLSSSSQANWRKLEQNSTGTLKTFFKPSTCGTKFVAIRDGFMFRREMDIRQWKVQGSQVRCKNGTACIKSSFRSAAAGSSWSTPLNATQFAGSDAKSLDMTMASRCTPNVRPARSGTTWKYRTGDPTAGAAKKMSITGNRRHTTDAFFGAMGICRVQLYGAGYIGTMYDTQTSSVWVHNGTKYVQKTVSGEHTVCTVQIDQQRIGRAGSNPPKFRGGRTFFNFEYLDGNLQERHWTSNSLSRGAKVANIDGGAARACMRIWTEKLYNTTTGQLATLNYRGFGFRKPGSTWCYTARHVQATKSYYNQSQGEGYSSKVRLLKK